MRITATGSASSGDVANVSRPCASTGPLVIDERADPSPSRSSHSGCLLPMVGSTAKLYAGGGDDTAHSSVPASHGFGPASAPRDRLLHTFTRNSRNPRAN